MTKVLLVEDDSDHVLLTLHALKLAGLDTRVEIARDGEEALRMMLPESADGAGEDQQLPGLVLLDLNLPRVSGFEVLDKLKRHARTRRIPVVVLTSSEEDEDVARCYDLCANSYVRKPESYEEFLAVSRKLAEYWSEVNRGIGHA
jgi:two-component system, response regulator